MITISSGDVSPALNGVAADLPIGLHNTGQPNWLTAVSDFIGDIDYSQGNIGGRSNSYSVGYCKLMLQNILMFQRIQVNNDCFIHEFKNSGNLTVWKRKRHSGGVGRLKGLGQYDEDQEVFSLDGHDMQTYDIDSYSTDGEVETDGKLLAFTVTYVDMAML